MIAIIVPTIRPESYKTFLEAWNPLFEKHQVELITVWDGKKPKLEHRGKKYTPKQVMGKYESCLTNFNAGIRNLGFAYVAKNLPDVQFIITLDDDLIPVGDPIQDHIDALDRRVPVSWMMTAGDYTRGFPYGIRTEAEVVLSHGVWTGVADWDAPTQLVLGSHRPTTFYQGVVPKGILFPVCAMNMAFKRKLLPYIFQAPWDEGVYRFDDIFAGIVAKREIDERGWAAVTGYATVNHQRASDVFKNLQNEALGIQLNETYWQGDESHPYFKIYKERLDTWQEYLKTLQ
jgi:reversibly glycosylated polypeptide/UDP-arabinopyranose mutase